MTDLPYDVDRIRQDKADVLSLAQSFLKLKRCPGLRIIVDGYICIHCGADPSTGACNGVTPKIKGREE